MARPTRRTPSLASLALVVLWASSGIALAQVVGGGIQGTVKDAQGSVLPGASVLVQNAATGASYEQTTDQAGHFQVPALPPGEYEVHIKLTGFRPLVHRGIRLAVGQVAVLDTPSSLASSRKRSRCAATRCRST